MTLMLVVTLLLYGGLFKMMFFDQYIYFFYLWIYIGYIFYMVGISHKSAAILKMDASAEILMLLGSCLMISEG